jgi:hypothetical protein
MPGTLPYVIAHIVRFVPPLAKVLPSGLKAMQLLVVSVVMAAVLLLLAVFHTVTAPSLVPLARRVPGPGAMHVISEPGPVRVAVLLRAATSQSMSVPSERRFASLFPSELNARECKVELVRARVAMFEREGMSHS